MADEREPQEPPSIDEKGFKSRLEKAREAQAETRAEAPGSAHGLALRVGSDFAGGIIVGGLLGWGIDRTFGTAPWGLMICLALGFVAGTNLAIRSANEINKRGAEGSGAKGNPSGDG